jgi:SAM-dependent methyltransferase
MTQQNAQSLWDRRYSSEREIWGERPSLVGQMVYEMTSSGSRILDVGAGYGRDEFYLLRKGDRYVYAVEPSQEGCNMMLQRARELKSRHWPIIIKNDFNAEPFRHQKGPLRRNFFDAVMSHRTLHLLDKQQVKPFAQKIMACVRPGGLIVVSARCTSDFDQQDMTWIDEGEGIAEYNKRPGHRITFWNQRMLKEHFQGLEIENISYEEEIEALRGPKLTKLIFMIARKPLHVPANAF